MRTKASSWWSQVLQNRLIALVLAMVVIVPLAATPADHNVAGIAALTFEGFGILLLVTLLWRTRWNLSRESVVTFFRTGANLPVALFFGLAIVSCILSPQKAFSIQETLKLGAGVLLYFVVAYQFRQSKHLSMLVDTLLFLAVSASVIGMAQYGLTESDRATALFGNDQLLGSFLMILLPVVAVIALTEKAPKRQIAAQTATVLTAGCLLLAHSRSAWIGAAAGLTVLGVLATLVSAKQGKLSVQKHAFVLPLMLTVVSAGFFCLVSTQAPSVGERAGSLSNISGDASWQLRQQQWQGTIQMIKARPLTGWGAGLYPYYQQQFTAEGLPVSSLSSRASLGEQAHNFYLQTAAEMGIPGLLLMVTVLVVFLLTAVDKVAKLDAGIRRSLLMGSIASTVAFAVDAISSPSWQFGQTAMFMWLMLGVGVSCLRPRVKQDEEAAVVVFSPRVTRPFAAAAACLALVGVLPTFSMAPDGNKYKHHHHKGGHMHHKPPKHKHHKMKADFMDDVVFTVDFDDNTTQNVTADSNSSYSETGGSDYGRWNDPDGSGVVTASDPDPA